MKLEKLELANQINTVDDWGKYAPPFGGESQWQDGRSAKELAKYIINNDNGYKELQDCFDIMDVNPQNILWAPEFVTGFNSNDFGTGEGRHHDLILEDNDKVFFAGIEAKADETFDELVSSWLNSGKSEGSKLNRKNRIDGMCNLIFGEPYDESKYGNLRYQLFSALTGVLVEAQNRNVKKAALIILTFKKNDKDGNTAWTERKIKRNDEDLAKFLREGKYDEETCIFQTKSSVPEVYVIHKEIQ